MGLGFGVKGFRFMIRVKGLGFIELYGLGFRVYGVKILNTLRG